MCTVLVTTMWVARLKLPVICMLAHLSDRCELLVLLSDLLLWMVVQQLQLPPVMLLL